MPKVMLIEDDQVMLQLLKTLLQMEGFEVAIPKNPSAASLSAAIQEESPQLLLMDVHLKKANGLDLLKTIRQAPDCSGMKVIMTSGLDFHEQCQRAGADGFLLKPFMADELVNAIRTSLAQ